MAWVIALAVLLAATPALAKKRVVVLGFDGPQAGKAEAAVSAAVGKQSTVVSAAQYKKAQKKLKIKKLTDKNHARIAAEIGVDAVVSGVVTRKGTKWSLVVVVREGQSGKVKATMRIPLRGPKIDAKARGDIAAKVPGAIKKVRPVSGSAVDADADADVDDGGDEGAVDDEVAEDEPPPPPKKKPGKGKAVAKVEPEPDPESAEEDDNPLEERNEEDEPVPGIDDERPAKKTARAGDDDDDPDGSVRASGGGTLLGARERYWRHPAVEALGGVSFVSRSLTFTVRDALPAAQQPAGYQGSAVPGATIAGTIYPLAFGDPKGALGGLGLSFSFERVLVLKTRFKDDQGMAYEFAGTQQAWGVGLRYRLPIGSSPTLPSIEVGAGYNALSFSIGSGAVDTGVPDVSYAFIDPGVRVRVPLGSPRLAAHVDGRYLLVSSAGSFQSAQNYGPGTVAGFDLDVGLEFRPIPRLPIRLGVRYLRMAFAFTGEGARSNNLDMDPSSKDVGGALDQFRGGYISTGYLF